MIRGTGWCLTSSDSFGPSNRHFSCSRTCPGILDGRFSEYLSATLDELRGYEIVGPVVVKAADFGAPTTRERVVIVGVHRSCEIARIRDVDLQGKVTQPADRGSCVRGSCLQSISHSAKTPVNTGANISSHHQTWAISHDGRARSRAPFFRQVRFDDATVMVGSQDSSRRSTRHVSENASLTSIRVDVTRFLGTHGSGGTVKAQPFGRAPARTRAGFKRLVPFIRKRTE